MVKKIFSVLVTFLIMMTLAVLSTTIILRDTLTIDNILKIVNNFSSENVSTFDQVVDQAFKETGLEGNVSDYVDTKELEGVVQNYLNDFMSYQLADGELPSLRSDEIKNILDKVITEYENKTGNKVDRDELELTLKEADEEIAKSPKIADQMDNNTLVAAKTIYTIIASQTLIIALIVILLVLIGILFLINMNIEGTLSYLISSFLINGICIIIIPLILNAIFSGQEIVRLLTTPFYKVGICSIVISIAFLVINVIYKNVKKSKNIQNPPLDPPQNPPQDIEIPVQY